MAGLPSVNITFKEKTTQAIQRSERNIAGVILKDTTNAGSHTFTNINEVPVDLSEDNKKYLNLILKGYITTPKRVEVFVIDTGGSNSFNNALEHFNTKEIHYLTYPDGASGDMDNLITFAKRSRDEMDKYINIIAFNKKADNRGVINVTQDSVGELNTQGLVLAKTLGMLAGTPMTSSLTYAIVDDVTNAPIMSKTDLEAKIKAGELIYYQDNDKVRIAKGINSLTTFTEQEGEQLSSILVSNVVDMIETDIASGLKDTYIGKVKNSYNNKLILITTINGYLEGLKINDIIESYKVEIDIEENKKYLISKGISVDNMTDKEIKEANTGTSVFLKMDITILNVIESINIKIAI